MAPALWLPLAGGGTKADRNRLSGNSGHPNTSACTTSPRNCEFCLEPRVPASMSAVFKPGVSCLLCNFPEGRRPGLCREPESTRISALGATLVPPTHTSCMGGSDVAVKCRKFCETYLLRLPFTFKPGIQALRVDAWDTYAPRRGKIVATRVEEWRPLAPLAGVRTTTGSVLARTVLLPEALTAAVTNGACWGTVLVGAPSLVSEFGAGMYPSLLSASGCWHEGRATGMGCAQRDSHYTSAPQSDRGTPHQVSFLPPRPAPTTALPQTPVAVDSARAPIACGLASP